MLRISELTLLKKTSWLRGDTVEDGQKIYDDPEYNPIYPGGLSDYRRAELELYEKGPLAGAVRVTLKREKGPPDRISRVFYPGAIFWIDDEPPGRK